MNPMVNSPEILLNHAAFEAQIQQLRNKWAWPETRPDVDVAEWPLDGGGRELITRCIPQDAPFLILEIGSFLGSSAQKWLNSSPRVFVIAVDPWGGVVGGLCDETWSCFLGKAICFEGWAISHLSCFQLEI
jgi:hypothetical protein